MTKSDSVSTSTSTASPRPIRILLTGASGYLGQHLLSYWMTNGPFQEDRLIYEVVALVNRAQGLPEAIEKATMHPKVSVSIQTCNLTSASDLKTLFEDKYKDGFDVCIHSAALSSPRACEKDPPAAEAINCPKGFLDYLRSTPLIALSTDQVYDGRKNVVQDGPYQESADFPNPLNVYGQTKKQMEDYLKDSKNRSAPTVVLRSSIILGPLAPLAPEATHSTFLHFCQSRPTEATTYFVNEFRSVVSVQHVCKNLDWMVHSLTSTTTAKTSSFEIYHLGGPVRVNRYQMALAVFAKHAFANAKQYVLEAQQTSTTSPLDISMDSSKLQSWTGIVHEPNALEGIVDATFPSTPAN